jgi:hypothetical protein
MTNPNDTNDKGRNLLDLGGGNRNKLERAFKSLIGEKSATTVDPRLVDFLHQLGFQVEGRLLTHPAFEGKKANLPVGELKRPLKVALRIATKAFPETEFHLPFILARAKLERENKQALLEPEPEYDEDGFLDLDVS